MTSILRHCLQVIMRGTCYSKYVCVSWGCCYHDFCFVFKSDSLALLLVSIRLICQILPVFSFVCFHQVNLSDTSSLGWTIFSHVCRLMNYEILQVQGMMIMVRDKEILIPAYIIHVLWCGSTRLYISRDHICSNRSRLRTDCVWRPRFTLKLWYTKYLVSLA